MTETQRVLSETPKRISRPRRAAQRLTATSAPTKVLADEAGYESEAASSRAFEPWFGLAPADGRRRQMRAG